MKDNAENLNQKKESEEQLIFLKEKIDEVLHAIGCEKEIFEKITDYKKINVENLLNNFKTLLQFKYTKLELTKIVTENVQILYCDNELIKENIRFLEDFFVDTSAVKNVIYSYPNILTSDERKYKVLAMLNKFEIPENAQKCMLLENPYIFGLEANELEKQLKYLQRHSENYNKFVTKLIYYPTVIGTSFIEEINSVNE